MQDPATFTLADSSCESEAALAAALSIADREVGCKTDFSDGGKRAEIVVQTIVRSYPDALIVGVYAPNEYARALLKAKGLRSFFDGRYQSYAIVQSLYACSCGALHVA